MGNVSKLALKKINKEAIIFFSFEKSVKNHSYIV